METDPHKSSDAVEDRYCELVRQVKASLQIPVAVKLSLFFSSMAQGIQPTMSFSPPSEFQGEGRWTPEHFLVAAVASCFVSTFEGMAQSSHFLFGSLRLSEEGVLAKETNGWRFSEFRLRPFVTVLKEEDRDLAIRQLEKAEKSCLIARSLQCKVALVPAVQIEEELSVPTAT
jgi:organic hydroperoxide reductase OsmC/OhrA